MSSKEVNGLSRGKDNWECQLEATLTEMESHTCSDFEEEGRRHRIAFNSLYLFSFRSINYEANGEELYNVTRGVTASCLSIVRELPQFLLSLGRARSIASGRRGLHDT